MNNVKTTKKARGGEPRAATKDSAAGAFLSVCSIPRPRRNCQALLCSFFDAVSQRALPLADRIARAYRRAYRQRDRCDRELSLALDEAVSETERAQELADHWATEARRWADRKRALENAMEAGK